MANISGSPTITDINLYADSTIQQQPVGTLQWNKNGKRYRYVKAGAVNLVVGNLIQGPARDVQFTDMAVVSAAAGATIFSLTNGTTTTTADQFAGGELIVSVTPGIGQTFTITGNSVATSGAALTVTVEEPIRVALTTSSKVTIRAGDYNGVIVSPIARTGKTVGAAIWPIPAGSYGWIQSGGSAAALSDATVAALGESLSPSTTTAGATTKQVTLLETIGVASMLQVSAKVESVYLTID